MFDWVLDYKLFEGGCWLGVFVEVLLGLCKVLGVVWGVGYGGWDFVKVCKINWVLDVLFMCSEMCEFLIKVGGYIFILMSVMLCFVICVFGFGDVLFMCKVYCFGI